MLLRVVILALGLASASSFDVASVKPNKRFACLGRWDFKAAHGMVTAVNAPLLRIVSRAFGLTDDRITGPSWLDSQCFDITAKAPAGTSDDDLKPMLQDLLRERFHMVAHRETAERPVYALVPEKSGPRLPAFSGDFRPPAQAPGEVLFTVRHLPDLCERLGKVTGRPIIDETGLTGDYFIALTYTPALATAGADDSDSDTDILSAIRKQLGLRLEPRRAPVEILKIESIDKVPTGN